MSEVMVLVWRWCCTHSVNDDVTFIQSFIRLLRCTSKYDYMKIFWSSMHIVSVQNTLFVLCLCVGASFVFCVEQSFGRSFWSLSRQLCVFKSHSCLALCSHLCWVNCSLPVLSVRFVVQVVNESHESSPSLFRCSLSCLWIGRRQSCVCASVVVFSMSVWCLLLCPLCVGFFFTCTFYIFELIIHTHLEWCMKALTRSQSLEFLPPI